MNDTTNFLEKLFREHDEQMKQVQSVVKQSIGIDVLIIAEVSISPDKTAYKILFPSCSLDGMEIYSIHVYIPIEPLDTHLNRLADAITAIYQGQFGGTK